MVVSTISSFSRRGMYGSIQRICMSHFTSSSSVLSLMSISPSSSSSQQQQQLSALYKPSSIQSNSISSLTSTYTRSFSKVPISSPNEEGKPWYQPELDPKYSTAAKELEEENEGLDESDSPWEPEPDQEDYEEVAKFLLEAGKYDLGIDLCGRMVKKYGYKLTPELVALVREAAEKEPKYLAMAVKVLG